MASYIWRNLVTMWQTSSICCKIHARSQNNRQLPKKRNNSKISMQCRKFIVIIITSSITFMWALCKRDLCAASDSSDCVGSPELRLEKRLAKGVHHNFLYSRLWQFRIPINTSWPQHSCSLLQLNTVLHVVWFVLSKARFSDSWSENTFIIRQICMLFTWMFRSCRGCHFMNLQFTMFKWLALV